MDPDIGATRSSAPLSGELVDLIGEVSDAVNDGGATVRDDPGADAPKIGLGLWFEHEPCGTQFGERTGG